MLGTEVRKKVQGAGDEHGSFGVCELECSGSRGNRIRHRIDAVEVSTSAGTRVLSPDADGRLSFTFDLGAAHADQQDTAASRLAGDLKWSAPGHAVR